MFPRCRPCTAATTLPAAIMEGGFEINLTSVWRKKRGKKKRKKKTEMIAVEACPYAYALFSQHGFSCQLLHPNTGASRSELPQAPTCQHWSGRAARCARRLVAHHHLQTSVSQHFACNGAAPQGKPAPIPQYCAPPSPRCAPSGVPGPSQALTFKGIWL